MTDTPDLILQIYQAIANGLINDPKWKVTEDNFIRFDEVEGIQNPEGGAMTDADYPLAILRGPTRFKTDLQTGTETFGTHSPQGCDWLESGEWVFQLEITSDLLKLTNVSTQTLESINAVRRLGAKLGLDFVVGVKIDGNEREIGVADPENDGVRRIQTTINITVSTVYDGESLTGGA
jgi:hypothetical protein